MGNKILYLECYSGISGDMTVAALLDLAGREDLLRAALASLDLPGYAIAIGRREKCGIDAAAFDVILDEGPQPLSYDQPNAGAGSPQGLDPDPQHRTGRKKVLLRQAMAAGGPSRMKKHHRAVPGHSHEHSSDHSHGHSHDGGHSHDHRNIHDIEQIIESSEITAGAKELARRVFRILAVAEARAHGLGVDQVHFHEVGAIDSIVDIVAACVLVDALGADEIVVSQIHEGSGHVWCQHGVIPVPVPATLNIAAEHGLDLKLTDTPGEMVTPTGAALAAALRSRPALPADYRILAAGVGSGKKDFRHANILRAYLLEAAASAEPAGDQVMLLETNLDDCTGEALGFVMEELLAQGALDVWFTSIQMKKNRPAHKLSALCRPEDRMKLEHLIFQHTTAIGIRRLVMERTILPRQARTVQTVYGPVSVKAVQLDGETFHTPEYEDLRRILKEHGRLSYQTLYGQVLAAIRDQLPGGDADGIQPEA